MAKRELILSFEGPPGVVRPELCDLRSWMVVVLRFVELVEKVGAHEAVDSEHAPFTVVMKELRAGSIQSVLDFRTRDSNVGVGAARRLGLEAARLAPKYLEIRDSGPAGIRTSCRRLAAALSKLPSTFDVRLRGSVELSLSALCHSDPAATSVSVESFRAMILRAGGLAPRVQLRALRNAQPMTFEAPEDLAKLAGQTLYSEADVTAKVERNQDGGFVHGVLTELRVLDAGDPVAAFDRWYEEAGRPWKNVADIEQGLGRGGR